MQIALDYQVYQLALPVRKVKGGWSFRYQNMQQIVPQTATFLFLLFLLIPGYITLRAFYFSVISIDDLSRMDKLATIVTGGFASLFVVGALHRLNVPSIVMVLAELGVDYTCQVRGFGGGGVMHSVKLPLFGEAFALRCPRSVSQYSFNGQINVAGFTNPGLVSSGIIITIQSVVGLVIGYAYGVYRRNLDENPQTREELTQPWQRAYEVTDIGQTATIVTPENRMVEGTIQQLGSPSKDYDILLANPKEVNRELGGEVINKRRIGNYSYHNYRDISRIEFGSPTDEDLYDPESETEGNRSFKEEVNTRFSALTKTLRIIFGEPSKKPSETVIDEDIDEEDVEVKD